jgi:hypothetical protein
MKTAVGKKRDMEGCRNPRSLRTLVRTLPVRLKMAQAKIARAMLALPQRSKHGG